MTPIAFFVERYVGDFNPSTTTRESYKTSKEGYCRTAATALCQEPDNVHMIDISDFTMFVTMSISSSIFGVVSLAQFTEQSLCALPIFSNAVNLNLSRYTFCFVLGIPYLPSS